jgi:hypothetical protein
MSETGRMQPTMEARSKPFAAALHSASVMAQRVGLGTHIPTRLRLAAVYAAPAADYGDVVWGTPLLRPDKCLQNPLQQQFFSHLHHVAGVPASTPRWPLLRELGVQPLQRRWWSHTARFFTSSASPAGQQASPLMAEALRADMALALQQGPSSTTWSGELLASIQAVEGGTHAAPGPIQQAARQLLPLPTATLLHLVDAAYLQQSQQDRVGDPRAADTQHRPDATYNAWFQPSAGCVVQQARGHTSSRECSRAISALRLRLGAVGVAANKGRHAGSPFQHRLCLACVTAGGGQHVGDVQHACFECPSIQQQLQGLGWEGIPGNATGFQQLFTEHGETALHYVGAVAELVDGRREQRG